MTRRGFLQSTLLSLTLITTRRMASPILLSERRIILPGGQRWFMFDGSGDEVWAPARAFTQLESDRGAYEVIQVMNRWKPMPKWAKFIDPEVRDKAVLLQT